MHKGNLKKIKIKTTLSTAKGVQLRGKRPSSDADTPSRGYFHTDLL